MHRGYFKNGPWQPRALSVLGILALLLAACAPSASESTPTRSLSTTAPASIATPVPTRAPSTPSGSPTPTPKSAPTAAPEAKPKYGGTVKTFVRGDPPGWDFLAVGGAAADLRKQHNLVFSMLATLRPVSADKPCINGLSPELLESWKWVNDTTLEGHIRQGAKFHNIPPVNGREVTGADVAWSFNEIRKRHPRAAAMAGPLKDVVAVDKYTVRFMTESAWPVLPYSLFATQYGALVVPPEAQDSQRGFGDPARSYIGSGPFQFKQWVPGVKISYAKNPSYWRPGLPYVDGLDYLIIPDMSTRLAGLRSGIIDVLTDEVPQPAVEGLGKAGSGIVITSCPSGSPGAVVIRTDKPPFNDVRVRRAVSMAIDREALISATMLGQGALSTVAPPVHPFYPTLNELPQETRKYLELRVPDAKALLADAGYAKGLKTTMVTSTRLGSPFNEEVEALLSMFEKVGIQVDLKVLEWTQYLKTAPQGDYEGLGMVKASAENVYEYLATYHSSADPSVNRSHVKDPELDKLLEVFQSSFAEAKQKELALRIAFRIVDQAYQIMLPGHMDTAAARSWVGNFQYHGFTGSRLANTWAETLWLNR